MKLLINGEAVEARARLLSVLLIELGYDAAGFLATAVNGELVPVHDRLAFSLSESDRIEILMPMQGG